MISQFEQIASMRGITLAPLADDLPLRDTGIDSLGIAVFLTRLEDVFGVYAFNDDTEKFPVTFGDLVRLYERLVSEDMMSEDEERLSSERPDGERAIGTAMTIGLPTR